MLFSSFIYLIITITVLNIRDDRRKAVECGHLMFHTASVSYALDVDV